jgi:hypothetical protein
MPETNESMEFGYDAKNSGPPFRIPMENLEVWSAGRGFEYVYTEDWETAKVIRNMAGPLTTYELGGKVFAWQALLTSKQLRQIILQFRRKNHVENKGLTAPSVSHSPQDRPEMAEGIKIHSGEGLMISEGVNQSSSSSIAEEGQVL